jgi:tetratricopeptide (TPR) repeat protein
VRKILIIEIILMIILMIVALAGLSILVTGIALPEWGITVFVVVAISALILLGPVWNVYLGPATSNQRGLARARNGDLAGAIAEFDRAIAFNPNFAEARYNRGFARYGTGDLAGAIADYTRIIKLNSPDLAGYLNQGVLLAKQGNRADAIAGYSPAIEPSPGLAVAYANRGVILVEQGNLDSAIADLNRAIEIAPRLVPTYVNRGLAHARKGDRAGAIADYDEAIRLSPTDADKAWIYACRAGGYVIMGDAPTACESLAAAIALNPQWRDLARTEPQFDPIRGEPCFQALIAEPTTSP